MFSIVSPFALLIPIILYLTVLGVVFWLVMRLIRSNEKIAQQTERIAMAPMEKIRLKEKTKRSEYLRYIIYSELLCSGAFYSSLCDETEASGSSSGNEKRRFRL